MSRYLLAVVIAYILILLFAAGADAQDGCAVPVHLAQAVDLAIEGRPEQFQAMEKKNIARSKVKEARGNFLPTLDLCASNDYTQNFDTFTGIEDISAQIAGQQVTVTFRKEVPAYELSGALDLVYNLYAGGRDSALLDEALYNLEAARHEEEIALRKIRLEVANAYWELKKAQVTMNLFNGLRTRERIRQAEAEQRIKRLELMEKERALAQERRERQTALQTAQDQLDLALARKKLDKARQLVAASELRSGRTSRLDYRQKKVEAENTADEATIARIDVTVAQNALALIVLE